MINKEKNISERWFVRCIMWCSEIFISQYGISQGSTGCNKNFFRAANHGGATIRKH